MLCAGTACISKQPYRGHASGTFLVKRYGTRFIEMRDLFTSLLFFVFITVAWRPVQERNVPARVLGKSVHNWRSYITHIVLHVGYTLRALWRLSHVLLWETWDILYMLASRCDFFNSFLGWGMHLDIECLSCFLFLGHWKCLVHSKDVPLLSYTGLLHRQGTYLMHMKHTWHTWNTQGHV